jgi:AraC family transcriptional regulator
LLFSRDARARFREGLIMQLQEQGQIKYGDQDLLASSAVAGWRGIAADHRRHPRGEIASFQPEHLEIGIATACHPESIVSRTGDRIRQHTRVEPGTIWFCPTGVLEEDIVISEWHDVLHIYLPPERFAELSDARGGAAIRPEDVPYLGGIYDERIRRIAGRLAGHLHAPSAAASTLLTTLALELVACITDTYANVSHGMNGAGSNPRLDARRLRHVLDYMTAHIDADIGLDDLAGAACFSTFHFIRAFANTTGMPPYRYLSRLRLERAKTLLALRKVPISHVALASCFSSQSNFTRAFRRATGVTPRVYRDQTR